VSNIFRGLGAVFYKEVLHVRRDFTTLFFYLIIPLLHMVVLGFGIDTNVRQVNTVVYNLDGRRESRELIDRLKISDTFHILRYVQSDRELNDAIISGRARVGIKIPVDYSDRLIHKMSEQVLVLIDASDSPRERLYGCPRIGVVNPNMKLAPTKGCQPTVVCRTIGELT
jgi:hypothetical protein